MALSLLSLMDDISYLMSNAVTSVKVGMPTVCENYSSTML